MKLTLSTLRTSPGAGGLQHGEASPLRVQVKVRGEPAVGEPAGRPEPQFICWKESAEAL